MLRLTSIESATPVKSVVCLTTVGPSLLIFMTYSLTNIQKWTHNSTTHFNTHIPIPIVDLMEYRKRTSKEFYMLCLLTLLAAEAKEATKKGSGPRRLRRK